ncbi:MAG: hypothetical protein VYA34_17370 [Myxococcota bacterium]|nr:hypothetical protein [Myxococcota bacterium]
MKNKRIFTGLILLGFCFPQLASAYELMGTKWYMNEYPNGVAWCPAVETASGANSANKRGAFLLALQSAMGNWSHSSLECSGYRHKESSCSGFPSTNSEEHWVYWEQDWGSVGAGSGTIGVTLTVSSGSKNYRSQVVFNDYNYTWGTDGANTDVQSIATHEFGHFVGLDHYDDYDYDKRQACQAWDGAYPAVMCAGHTGGNVRVLTQDDIAGVCSLYPVTGAAGSACRDNSDCDSGVCHPNGYCSDDCTNDGDCPNSYECDNGLCQPRATTSVGGDQNCGPCGTLDCIDASFCVQSQAGVFCSRPCSQDGHCPFGFGCYSVEGDAGGCFPYANSCSLDGPGAGDACGPGAVCALGNICLRYGTVQSCYEICRSNADCDGRSCSNVGDVSVCVEFEGGSTGEGGANTNGDNTNGDNTNGANTNGDNTNGANTNGDNTNGSGNEDACGCNSTANCDAGCLCSSNCGGNTIGGNEGGTMVQEGGEDLSLGCSCDQYWGCEVGCSCDPDCLSSSGCSCDKFVGCDEGCPCDSECVGSGCHGTGVDTQSGGPNIFLLFMGGLLFWYGARRRSFV